MKATSSHPHASSPRVYPPAPRDARAPKPPLPHAARRLPRLSLPRDPGIYILLFLCAALALMAYTYISTRQLVTVSVNETERQFWTHQTTVRGALIEAGYKWNPEDIIRPALDEALPAHGKIFIKLAAPIVIGADGNVLERRTQSTTVAGVLRENEIQLKPSDKVYLDGRLVDANANLPRYSASAGRVAMPAALFAPMHLTIERAVPLSVNDNGLVSTIYTTEATLGTALHNAGVLVYLGDYVTPDLGNPVSAGAAVFIRRSRPATISADGRIIKTRTRATNVAGLLAQEGIQLEGKDYAAPPPTSPVLDNLNISVTRVREEFFTETLPIAFETKWLPNPNMEIDERAIVQTGEKGAKNRLFKSVFENGKMISRGLEREWIAKPPQTHIINYGTKVVVRDLTLNDGAILHYWRKIRMLATSYTAATSGKKRTHPEYGITFIGLAAGRGIVAIDPKVVNLRSNVYVPGYGLALAGDTGGRIKGKRIDLGYAEDNLDLWYRWIEVYLLTPVPPARQINYILPDNPRESPRSTAGR